MRHRRLKQYITYKYGNDRDSKRIHQNRKHLAINFAKQLGKSISTMKDGELYFTSEGILDPTFKWHRDHEFFGNCIEFGGDEYEYGTIIRVVRRWGE